MQKKIIALAIAFLISLSIFTIVYIDRSANPDGFSIALRISTSIVIFKHLDSFPEASLLAEGYKADCEIACSGIHYSLDPVGRISNVGMTWIANKLHTSGYQNTTNVARSIFISVSGGASPSYTDTLCPATVQTTNGLSPINAVVTIGSPSSGVIVTTIINAFTASGSTTSIDFTCLTTSTTLSGSGAYMLFAESNLPVFSTLSGDLITITWTETASSS